MTILEESILKSVKKILGVPVEETVFDFDILTQINTALNRLNQLGVGPDDGMYVEDEYATWDDFIEGNEYNMVKTYVAVKARMYFDPPQMSYMITAMNDQIRELESLISHEREWGLDPNDPMEVSDV